MQARKVITEDQLPGGKRQGHESSKHSPKTVMVSAQEKNARHQLHTGGDSAHERATKSLIKLWGPFFGKAALKRERVESESEG